MTRIVNSRKDLNDEERLHLFMLLYKDFDGKKLIHGSIKKNADLFGVSSKTVSRIWDLGLKSLADGKGVDLSKKLHKRVGQKSIHLDIEKLKEIPLRRRKTIVSLAHALGMSKSTVHRRIKNGVIRRHSSAVKPQLTEENKKARLRFCMSMLQVQSSIDGRTKMKLMEMFDHVVIDEKWFYLMKESEKYYLAADEVDPYRCCKSKKFITKVMFLAAVARPRFDESGNVLFDGKIGIFPFCYQEPAKRKSKNRPAGTMETKAIDAVNQDVSRAWMIEKVLPAIRDRWPMCSRGSTIYIQQDNARPHIKASDEKFVEAAKIDGFDIRLQCQPPNSPELNILDLGYFRAIQSLQYQEAPRNIDELIKAVDKSYQDLSPKALNRVFITLQECMVEVMKCGGGNNFKVPHMKKEKLDREGMLPLSLTVDNEILQVVNEHLQVVSAGV